MKEQNLNERMKLLLKKSHLILGIQQWFRIAAIGYNPLKLITFSGCISNEMPTSKAFVFKTLEIRFNSFTVSESVVSFSNSSKTFSTSMFCMVQFSWHSIMCTSLLSSSDNRRPRITVKARKRCFEYFRSFFSSHDLIKLHSSWCTLESVQSEQTGNLHFPGHKDSFGRIFKKNWVIKIFS